MDFQHDRNIYGLVWWKDEGCYGVTKQSDVIGVATLGEGVADDFNPQSKVDVFRRSSSPFITSGPVIGFGNIVYDVAVQGSCDDEITKSVINMAFTRLLGVFNVISPLHVPLVYHTAWLYNIPRAKQRLGHLHPLATNAEDDAHQLHMLHMRYQALVPTSTFPPSHMGHLVGESSAQAVCHQMPRGFQPRFPDSAWSIHSFVDIHFATYLP